MAPKGLTFSDSGLSADEAPRPMGPPATPATSSPRTRLARGSGTIQAGLSPALQSRSRLTLPMLLEKKDEREEEVLAFQQQQE